ncbi:MAG: cytidine deaminase [Sphingomicrobium sp.]
MDPLVAAARAAAAKAHAPYSGFAVGCAVESIDGQVVTGANMENACYRLGICAEQAALAAAQAAFGLDKIARIAVSAPLSAVPVTPCGGCRQAILEAGGDIIVLCASGDGERVETHRIADLLPHAFRLDPPA